MSLHLVELSLDMRALHLWVGGRKFGQAFDEGQALHHLLGEVFGAAVLQPFRLMVAPRAQTGTIYAYATQDAESLRAVAMGSLTPGQADLLGLKQMRSLPRPTDTWRGSQRIGFDLRVRPVVRLASNLVGKNDAGVPVNFRKGAELDAFLAHVLRGGEISREQVYLDWLAQRIGAVAEIVPAITRMASFQRTVIQRGGKRLEGPDAVMHGTLSIVDPAGFTALLAKGIGRHKSYGYGMLLLRPAQKLV